MAKMKVQKFGSAKEVKRATKGGGGKGFIKFIGDEGLMVRFLTEPDGWIGFYEYFDAAAKTAIPMTEGEELPDGVDRASFRFLAAVWDVENNKVELLKVPKSLAGDIEARYEHRGTIMDRDHYLSREGTGLDTEYSVMDEDKYKIKGLKDIEVPDPDAMIAKLEAARANALGEDEEEEERPAKKKKKKKTSGEPVKKMKETEKQSSRDGSTKTSRAAKNKVAPKRVVRRPARR
jgi:hypothetical protein